MDEGALEGRVVDPGSAVPGWFSDAVSAPAGAISTPDAGAGKLLPQLAVEVDGPGAVAAVGGPAGTGDVPAVAAVPSTGDSLVGVVDSFRQWLASVDADALSDRERVDLVASLERVKGASSAVQARATDALRCSREVVAPRDVARSVGSVVALARRESPTLGDRFVGLSRALVHEMPVTMAALTAGEISERVGVAVVAATATLSLQDRAEVDRRLGPVITGLGVRQAGGAAARVAAELDAASVVARMEAAVKGRRVTVRPAPDGMAYLTVLGPLKDVVGAHVAVQARARGVVGGQCPDEAPQGRGVGAVAADTALRLLSGRAVGQPQPVEVHLVMTDRALLGTGNPDRSVFEPARVPGHGCVPAPVARAWLREGLDDGLDGGAPATATPGCSTPTLSQDFRLPGAASASGEVPAPPHTAAGSAGQRALVPAASLTGRTGSATGLPAAARVWVRRLYTTPDGRDLVAMDSRRRVFGGMLRRMLVLRDDVCTTSWCEAPIVHADHARPVREHAETSYEEGNGKCTRCNYGKEAPGWRTRVILTQPGVDEPPPERTGRRGDEARPRRVVQVTTPLGHAYDAEPPPLLGWGSQTFPPAPTVPDMPQMPNRKPAPQEAFRSPEDSSGRPVPGQRRKRALRRARTLSGTALDRSPRARRPRLTSHLERELCRYLT